MQQPPIRDLWVAEAHRRRGIGSSLVAVVVEAGGRRAWIAPENEASLATFRRCGFRRTGAVQRRR